MPDPMMEKYAMEVYRSVFDLIDYEVLDFESPDFILWKKHSEKIGLETTTPSSQYQNELKKIANLSVIEREMLGDHLNFEKYKDAKRIYDDGVVLESSSSADLHDILLAIIVRKLEKLNDKYTRFDKNVLCCTPYNAGLYSEKDYKDFVIRLNESIYRYSLLFDEIIIISPDTVIKYSSFAKHYYIFDREIELSNDLSITLQRKAGFDI